MQSYRVFSLLNFILIEMKSLGYSLLPLVHFKNLSCESLEGKKHSNQGETLDFIWSVCFLESDYVFIWVSFQQNVLFC